MIPVRTGTNTVLAYTGNVGIRRFEIADAPLLYEAVRESLLELTGRMAWCSVDYSQDDALRFLQHEPTSWADGSRYDLAIINPNDGSFLGSIGFSKLHRPHQVANIGYWVRTNRTNHGIARRAVVLAARFGFDHLNLNRIEFVVEVGNEPSLRAARAAGAKEEGILRKRIVLQGTTHDAVLLSMVRTG